MEEKIFGAETEENIKIDSVQVKPVLDCWPDLKLAEEEEEDDKNRLVIHAGVLLPLFLCNVMWCDGLWDNDLQLLYLRYEGLQKREE